MNTNGFAKTDHSYIVKYKGYTKEFEFGNSTDKALKEAETWMKNIEVYLDEKTSKLDKIKRAIVLGYQLKWTGSDLPLKGIYPYTSNFTGTIQVKLQDNKRFNVDVDEIEILNK